MADTMMWNIRGSEAINRGVIYLAELERYLGKGKGFEMASNLAKKSALEVHFKYTHNIPRLVSSPIGRALGFFSTYPVKQTEYMANMLANKEVSSIIKYIATTYGLIKGFEMMGIDISRESGGGLFADKLSNIPVVGEYAKYAPVGMMPTGIPFASTLGPFSTNLMKAAQGDPAAQRKIDLRDMGNWRSVPIMPGGRFLSDLNNAVDLVKTGQMRTGTGKVGYETSDPMEIALIGLGFRTTHRAEVDNIYQKTVSLRKETEQTVNSIALSYIDGNIDDAKSKFQKAIKEGKIKPEQVVSRIKSLQTPFLQSAIKNLNKHDKLMLLLYLKDKGGME